MQTQRTKGIFFRFLCGLLIGVSIIAPGVSGSIIAVIMGIYDRLISIISNPFRNFKRNFVYLLPMGVGALLSVLLFVRVFRWLFEHYPTPGHLLFIGLIGGSLPLVFRQANRGAFKARYPVAAALALCVALGLGLLEHSGLFLAAETGSPLYLGLGGLAAGAAGIVPGMSVSVMLMVLGLYETLLTAASSFDVWTLAPVGVGFIAGMMALSHLIKFTFRRYPNFSYYAVFGFMLGAIIGILPALPQGPVEWVASAAALGLGLGTAYLFQRLGEKFKHEEE